MLVLILIVVEDGLVRFGGKLNLQTLEVLILIVVEDGLVLNKLYSIYLIDTRLNPYCSGRWSRTLLRKVVRLNLAKS